MTQHPQMSTVEKLEALVRQAGFKDYVFAVIDQGKAVLIRGGELETYTLAPTEKK